MAGRGDRWDRERFHFERERDRYDERSRYDDDDARSYTRHSPPPPARFREDERRRPAFDDEYAARERRYYGDEPRYIRRPLSPRREEIERRVMVEQERRVRSPSPRRRPGMLLRRQSSLDTFDRRPRVVHEREEYGPPARREDYRPPAYVPIPLPRSRALPPPRRYEHMDEIRVSDPDYYGDEEFRSYPERVREREVVRTRRRERSRSRARSHHSSTVRSSSRSSSTTSSSSSRTTTTVKSEYPKKGKTRIPARLVSKRAIIDLGYPFEEEGNTIIIQKALGQENIDDLLKLSEDYKKSEVEVLAARSEAGEIIEERRREEVYVAAPPPPPPIAMPVPAPPPPPSVVIREDVPVIVNAGPPPAPVAPPPVINTTTTMVVRDASPTRSTTSYSSYTTDSTSTVRAPIILDAGPRHYREVSDEIGVGPLALVDRRRSRHRSHSRGDIVRAERLSDGQLVIYEERVEKIEEPRRGVRIEKDKKGPPPKLVRAMLATLT